MLCKEWSFGHGVLRQVGHGQGFAYEAWTWRFWHKAMVMDVGEIGGQAADG